MTSQPGEGSGEAGLVQCQITGKWAREEDTVVLQGLRVCAEGKAELLDRLRSGAALPGGLECPGVLRRFGAMLVDGLVYFLLVAVILVVASSVMSVSTQRVVRLIQTRRATGLVMALAVCAYFTLLHGLRGQTVGKRVAGLLVVNNDGSPITMLTALKRTAVFAGPLVFLHVVDQVLPVIGRGILVCNAVIWLFLLADAVAMLPDSQRQRTIHDRVAGTRVVLKSSVAAAQSGSASQV